jgi:hypothetical protein
MAQTPRGYPYPLGTDRVMDGDDAIKALAQAVNDRLGAIAAGQLTVTPVSADTAINTPVNFPAGRFSVAPLVFVVSNATAQQPGTIIRCWSGSVTPAGCNIGLSRSAVVATLLYWLAIEI